MLYYYCATNLSSTQWNILEKYEKFKQVLTFLCEKKNPDGMIDS